MSVNIRRVRGVSYLALCNIQAVADIAKVFPLVDLVFLSDHEYLRRQRHKPSRMELRLLIRSAR